MASITVEPLNPTLGATVRGVSLVALDDDSWQAIESAFTQYAVLVFPDQHLSHDEQETFAKRFGSLEQIAENVITNQALDGSLLSEDDRKISLMKGNEVWHTDGSFKSVSSKASMLSAVVVPDRGGTTQWADMRAGYEALPADLRSKVDGLVAYHSYAHSQARIGAPGFGEVYGGNIDASPLRPLVKEHPVTHRKALFIGRHAFGIQGMTDEESERFLEDLHDFVCQPPRIYEHHWSVGDIVVWDNRCVLHRARPWDLREPRYMRHTRIAGDPATERALEPTNS